MMEVAKLGLKFIDKKHILMPKFATPNSACFDLHANFYTNEITAYDKNNRKSMKYTIYPSNLNTTDIKDRMLVVQPKERYMIPTNIIFDIPPGHHIQLYSRSGLSIKNGIVLANNVGIIDEDYVHETFIPITNISDSSIAINHGDRIAQGMIVKNCDVIMEEIKDIEQKTTRNGGFGSTGVS